MSSSKNCTCKRRLEGQHSQSWVENTNMNEYHQSINFKKHLPQSPFTGQFFLDDDILHFPLLSI